MNTIIFKIFLAIIANSGCNNQNPDSSEISNISVTNIEPSDNPAIYGEWSICTFNSNGHIIQLNICQILIFKKDGTGAELSGSNHSSFFKWTLQKNVLIISAKADNRGFFMNGVFKAFTATKDRQSTLLIIDPADNTQYELSKHLPPPGAFR